MYFLVFYPDIVTSLTFLFGRLVPYHGSLVALFQHLSNSELLLVTTCAVAFCLQIRPFFLGSCVLHSPGAVLPGKPAGLSIIHSQGNRLSLSSCFSEPGHSPCKEAEIKQSLYFSLCRLWHLLFPSAVSYPALEHVQDTAVIYFNIGVFDRIDRREGRWGTIKDVAKESLQVR